MGLKTVRGEIWGNFWGTTVARARLGCATTVPQFFPQFLFFCSTSKTVGPALSKLSRAEKFLGGPHLLLNLVKPSGGAQGFGV